RDTACRRYWLKEQANSGYAQAPMSSFLNFGGSAQRITIVAHDVGPPGGMELQLAELVQGLVGHGVRVTVIARRCTLEPHDKLTWIRVRCPARPFPLRYLWFFVAGSWKVARSGGDIVH